MQKTPLPKGQKPLAVSDNLYAGVKLTPVGKCFWLGELWFEFVATDGRH
jgi:hypothetical protein